MEVTEGVEETEGVEAAEGIDDDLGAGSDSLLLILPERRSALSFSDLDCLVWPACTLPAVNAFIVPAATETGLVEAELGAGIAGLEIISRTLSATDLPCC